MELILLHRPSTRWSADKDCKFWDAAATFVRDRSERTLSSCGDNFGILGLDCVTFQELVAGQG